MPENRDFATDSRAIDRLLDATHTWALVGLSNNTARAASRVASVLRAHGKRVIPVHPDAPTVGGEPGYRTLADIPVAVDVVDVFVRSDLAGSVADDAIAIGAQGVWFQLGVIDHHAAERVRGAGLDMVMDRCPVVEWDRRRPRSL